jgi:hypothetical protein
VIVVVLLACGCSRALSGPRPADARADAQLAARVRTVLVNDPDVGAYPIEVQVAGGLVRLSGRLDSFKYLVVTRVVACVISLPLLTTLMNFTGMQDFSDAFRISGGRRDG